MFVDGLAGIDVTHAESLGVEHTIALHDGGGHARHAAAAHDVADDVVEAVDRGVNAPRGMGTRDWASGGNWSNESDGWPADADPRAGAGAADAT